MATKPKRRMILESELVELTNQANDLVVVMRVVKDRTGTVPVTPERPCDTVERALLAQEALLKGAQTYVKQLTSDYNVAKTKLTQSREEYDKIWDDRVRILKERDVALAKLSEAKDFGHRAVFTAAVGWVGAVVLAIMLAAVGS